MEKTLSEILEAVPAEAREFLAAGDGLGRAAVLQRHPDVRETVAKDETRTAILAWLAHEDASAAANTSFATRCLQYLVPRAAPHEARVVRRYLMHGSVPARTAAYELFITLYFPDKNREALLMLLYNMMLDPEDAVRAQGVRFVERAGAVEELRPFLRQWRARAFQWGWRETSAYELVERLLFVPDPPEIA